MTTINKYLIVALLMSLPHLSYSRYYDPVISRWISVDPALEQGRYLPTPNDFDNGHDFYWHDINNKIDDLPGHGGIYRPINLDLYRYCSNNPIKYIDPDGLVDLNWFSSTKPKEKFIHDAAEKVKSPKNTYTIGAHGNATKGVHNKQGEAVSAKALAAKIKSDTKKYKSGMKVKIMSCNIGNNSAYAQEVSDRLGVTVEAPNNIVWYYQDGSSIVAPRQTEDKKSPKYKLPDTSKQGKFIEYNPKKRK